METGQCNYSMLDCQRQAHTYICFGFVGCGLLPHWLPVGYVIYLLAMFTCWSVCLSTCSVWSAPQHCLCQEHISDTWTKFLNKQNVVDSSSLIFFFIYLIFHWITLNDSHVLFCYFVQLWWLSQCFYVCACVCV